MLVELDFTIESILVVTYTNAAVSDLKGKIHSRLCSLRDAMTAFSSGETLEMDDEFASVYAKQRENTLHKDIKNDKECNKGLRPVLNIHYTRLLPAYA